MPITSSHSPARGQIFPLRRSGSRLIHTAMQPHRNDDAPKVKVAQRQAGIDLRVLIVGLLLVGAAVVSGM